VILFAIEKADARSAERSSRRESVFRIRSKTSRSSARYARKAKIDKNFFIAKKSDSESARRCFSLRKQRDSIRKFAFMLGALIKKTIGMRGFLEKMIGERAENSQKASGASKAARVACERCERRALHSMRQYFLKQDAVFFHVLV